MAPTRSNSKRPIPYKDALATLSPVPTAIKKASKPSTSPKVDLDTHCGVLTNGTRCTNPLVHCKVHTKGQKRAVGGRSMSYDMLPIPAWSPPLPLPNSEKDDEVMGRGDIGMAVNVARGKRTMEKVRENIPRENVPHDNGPREEVPRVSTATKPVEKRGPKAWTALEREVAKELKEFAGDIHSTTEQLEVARKIVARVREHTR